MDVAMLTNVCDIVYPIYPVAVAICILTWVLTIIISYLGLNYNYIIVLCANLEFAQSWDCAAHFPKFQVWRTILGSNMLELT